ncbi:MAG: lamin tail domain-containing protein, partial [Verrucomicrobiales bacterium]
SGNTDFAMLVADRIHKHFFNDGALTPSKNIERLQKRVDEARPGFISESARWGNRFREYQNWLSYQQNLANNHFPNLTATMIGRFRSAGMYPDIIAPVFSRHGGSVSPDTPVTMATDADTIYYTLDGSDPRLSGGTPNQNALVASFGGGGPSPVTYISSGHEWRYLDNGSDQGSAWRAPGFDDAGWAAGPSELGYGNDGEGAGTTVSFGPNSSGKYATTYFRTTVDIPDPSIFFNFLLRIKYDDGIAVYINGTEVLRQNLAAGAAFDTYAGGSVGDEDGWKDSTLPTSALSPGTNVIAVEIHQTSGTSSDIRLDMILRGETSQGGGDNVSDPLFLSRPTMIRTRSYNSAGSEWSALNEAFFSIDSVPASAANLVISELHYHPSNPTSVEEMAVSNDRDDFEFIEFFNTGQSALELAGVRFEFGINFAFPEHTILPAGGYLLLLRNREAFEARYGISPVQAFEYTGRLSNDGEALRIIGAQADPIRDFTYNDQVPWPTGADGDGSSLTLINPAGDPAHGDPANWAASRNPGGSPGTAEPAGITYAAWAALNGVQGEPGDDDDGDAISNYLEFLFGSRPDLASDAPVPSAGVQSIGATNYLTITFRKNLAADASLSVELSGNLATWSSSAEMLEPLSSVDNGDGTATVTVRLAEPISPGSRQVFLRLRGS